MIHYPFSPDVLDSLPESISELYRGLELTLIKEICGRLKAAGELNEVTVQMLRALRSHGIDLKEIKKAIQETAQISEEKLDKLLDEVVERNQQYYTELIDLAHVTRPETLVDAAAIDAIRRQTVGEFRNLSRSMAFVVDNGRTVLPPQKAFEWACDSAVLQVESGAISYNEAIRSAVRQLAQSGIKTAIYDNDYREQIDVSVRRSVMSSVNAINQKYREQSMDYLGTNLVEVTAHLGARNIPGPLGFEAHSEWQGFVYTWNREK